MMRSQVALIIAICWICGCSSGKTPRDQGGTSETSTRELSIDLRRDRHLGRRGEIYSRFDVPQVALSPATLNEFVEMLQQDFDRWHSVYGRSLVLSTKQTQLWQACKETLLESPSHSQIAETLISFHKENETSFIGPKLDGFFPTYIRAAFSENESLSKACDMVLTRLSPGWDDYTYIPSANEFDKGRLEIEELEKSLFSHYLHNEPHVIRPAVDLRIHTEEK